MTRHRLDTLALAAALAVILYVVGSFAVQTYDAYTYLQWRRELAERHPGWRIPPSGRPAP